MARQIIQQISDEPVGYAVILPVGSETIPPGTWEAMQYFANAIGEIRRKHPGLAFQIVPFEYSEPVMTRTETRGPLLTAMLLFGN